MRPFRKLWFVLLLPAFLGAPSSAQAQFRTFGGGYFGNVGGFGGNYGYGGMYGYPGGYGFGSMGGYGFGNIGGYGNFGYGPTFTPGFVGPQGAMPGFPGYSSSYYPNGFGPSGTVLSPGFGPSDSARLRPTLYPAIAQPSRQIIAAALEGDEKDRARIEIHVTSANAKVYLDGILTKQTGLDRIYVTPKLNPNSRYSFNVEVKDGNRTERRTLNLRAGETSVLNLRDPD